MTPPTPEYPHRYVVVGYDTYYPGGFDQDVLASFATEEEATRDLEQRQLDRRSRRDTMFVEDLLELARNGFNQDAGGAQ